MKCSIRSVRRCATAMLLVSVVAACGGDDGGDESSTSDPSAVSTPDDPAVVSGDPTTPAVPEAANAPADLTIVSMSPTATEMVFAIGAGDLLIAVDDQSNFPEQAVALQGPGLSSFEPNVEAVAALAPDLVLHDGSRPEFTDALTAAGIQQWAGPAALSFDDIYSQIEQLGAATGYIANAAALVASMQGDIDRIVADTPVPAAPLRYFHELDATLYTATSNTFIGQVYGKFGLINIADSTESGSDYPQLSAEFVVSANPDIIFLADADYGESPDTVAARPGWNAVTAVVNGQVVPVSADITSRWGPRVVQFVALIADAVANAPVPA
jgi:iron complex transport system substrate-binding protein